jgi:hypothetical protein
MGFDLCDVDYMMMKNKSPFYKTTLILVLLFGLSFLFLIVRKLVVFSCVFITFILGVFYWFRRLGEELIIYRLKQNAGKMKSLDLLNEFSKSGEKDISRLVRKRIVQLVNDEVHLLKADYFSVFGDNIKK